MQHGMLLLQAWPVPAQGGWQAQPVAPAVQLTMVPFKSGMTQLNPVQQAVPPAVHAVPWATHVTGGVQIPPVQVSVALQHGTVAEQLWFASAHTLTVWHVPLVAPGGIAQLYPAQQSPSTVQLAPPP